MLFWDANAPLPQQGKLAKAANQLADKGIELETCQAELSEASAHMEKAQHEREVIFHTKCF